MYEHEHAAFDVCLMAPNGPLQVVSVYKAFNQKDQDSNLRNCRKSQEGVGTICVSDWLVHHQAAYDVCLMKVAVTPAPQVVTATAPAAPVQAKPSQPTSAYRWTQNHAVPFSPYAAKHARFLSESNHCYRVDANGNTYGAILDDRFCHVGFLSESNHCYNVDAKLITYGAWVDDAFCRVDAWSESNACYSVDIRHNTYGAALDDAECSVGYKVSNNNCYHMDKHGQAYGAIVSDEYCQRK